MIIYFSGEQEVEKRPEYLLKSKACVMLTFYDNRKKPEERFLALYKKRLKEKKKHGDKKRKRN